MWKRKKPVSSAGEASKLQKTNAVPSQAAVAAGLDQNQLVDESSDKAIAKRAKASRKYVRALEKEAAKALAAAKKAAAKVKRAKRDHQVAMVSAANVSIDEGDTCEDRLGTIATMMGSIKEPLNEKVSSGPLWYHELLPRSAAEATLATAPSGAYLVREAQRKPGSAVREHVHTHSLSMRVPGDYSKATVKHFKIEQNKLSHAFILVNGAPNRPQFPTIEALVLHFETHPLSNSSDMVLEYPCRSSGESSA
jgi:hypothetical protein